MTVDPSGASAPALIDRIKNILLTPQTEWEKIDTEAADVNKIYLGYVLPLAALGAICAFIGTSVFGVNLFGTIYRVPMVTGLVGAVLQIGLSLAGVFLLAFVANALAPSFGSQQNMGQAHKLAAYGSTAGFLAGVFSIVPALAILGIVGLYSLYLLYVGMPRMMKTPEDKRLVYLIVLILVVAIAWIVIGTVMGAVRGAMGGAPAYPFGG
jgi:hypothetical protein